MIFKKNIVVLVIIIIALYLSSFVSFLLFHSLSELFSVVVACGIFIVAWNSRHILTNNYLLFLGVAYLFIGSIDLVHTLAYKGMGVFPEYDADLPTQLWTGARYMESLSLLTAPLLFDRRVRPGGILALYFVSTVLLLTSIFTDNFPACFVEGQGLTHFKVVSEYIISMILLGSLIMLYRRRDRFEQPVFGLIAASVILTIAAELAFTFYASVYGPSNFVGHSLKFISFYFIYLALIETGLRKPYDVLFRELRKSKDSLAESEEKYRLLFESSLDGFAYHRIVVDEQNRPVDYIFLEMNEAFERLTGLKRESVIGNRVTEVLPDIRLSEFDWISESGRVALTGESLRTEQFSEPLGKWYSISLFSPQSGYFGVFFEDITERKSIEKELMDYRHQLEQLVEERTKELNDANEALREEVEERKKAEVELKNAYRTTYAILEKSPLGIYVVNSEGVVEYVNLAMISISGARYDQFFGTNVFALPGYEEMGIAEKIREAIDGKAFTLGPVDYASPIGGRRTIRNFIGMSLMEEGERKALIFVEDVTEMVEARKLEATTGDLLKQFTRASSRKEYLETVAPIVRGWSGCANVGIRMLNGRDIPFEACVGYDREFLEKERDLSLDRDQCVCTRVIEERPDPQDILAMTPGGSFRCDSTIHFVNGLSDEERSRFRGVCVKNGYASVAVIPIKFRERMFGAIHLADEREGKVPVRLIESIEKLTPLIGEAVYRFHVEDELRRNFRNLEDANQLMEQMFANIHVLVAYMDEDFNFIRVNNSYADADGRVPEFYVGKNHFDLYPNKENERIFRDVAYSGMPYFAYEKPFEYAEHPERGVSYWDWSIFPIKGKDGRTAGLLLSLLNVTERRQARVEAVRSAHLASLGELAAGVAHEINNPINGIINYAQILLDEPGKVDLVTDLAGRVIKEGDRIALIVRSLLSFARESVDIMKPVSLREVIYDTVVLIEAHLLKDGIKLEINIPADIPDVFGHFQKLQQVFLNIISNSRYALNEKYPGADENKIIEIDAVVREQGSVSIVFRDRGIGMSPEVVRSAMNPFFTTKPVDKGTGLGLSISHGIIGDHRGKLRINSEEGKFTEVMIDIPVWLRDNE